MLDKKNMSKRHFISLEDQNKFADTLQVPHTHIYSKYLQHLIHPILLKIGLGYEATYTNV